MSTRVRVVERDRMLARERLEPWPVVERNALVQREPRERAVHRAGVEVAEAEPRGEPRATVLLPAPAGPSIATITVRSIAADLAWSGGAARTISKNAGKLTPTASAPSIAHALARDEAGDRAEHRDAVVAAAVDPAAAEPCRDAA